MKLATFEHNGERRIGISSKGSDGVFFDLLAASDVLGRGSEFQPLLTAADVGSLIQAASGAPDQIVRLEHETASLMDDVSLAGARIDINKVKLGAPISRPGKLVCLAGNYREHITESGFVAPSRADVITPQLFLKPSTSIIGDGDDIVLGKSNVRVGWETELAVIIGRRGKEIAESDALDYVFGYTVLNDISERRLNAQVESRRLRENDRFFDWLAGKWFDGFAPCGPWIVTRDEIDDPHNLEIKFFVNGEMRQRGNTRDMIFRIPETISYISSIMTLEAGDIISTGTPAGAGIGEGEARLRDGDEMVCEIEGIGRLHNKVRCAH